MRIAILTQYYPPEIGAPQNRLSDLAQRFVKRGHRVQVLTAMPNYPAGEVFPGYRGRRVMAEEIDGVPVKRAWLHTSKKRSFVNRLLNYVSFAVHASYEGPALFSEADFLLAESPPLFLGPAGVYLARRLNAKFVFNISDLWPASAVELGFLKPGLLERLARQMEEWCYRHSALITAQSEGIVANIRTRFPDQQVHLLPNGVDLDFWRAHHDRDKARARLRWPPSDFIAGYVGLLGHAQALEQVLEAAALLKGKRGIRFAFFGEGPCKESLIRQAAERGIGSVTFHAGRPHEEVPEIMTALDAALVTLARGPLFQGVRPSKLFEAMAAGKPVVLAGEGEVRRLVNEARCGLAVPAEDAAALARAIETLASQPTLGAGFGDQGKRFVARHFDRSRIATDFEEILQLLQDRDRARNKRAPQREPVEAASAQ